MATHPVADGGAKDENTTACADCSHVASSRASILAILARSYGIQVLAHHRNGVPAYAANVLENALASLSHEARERAFTQVDELLAEYSQWPFQRKAGGGASIGANLGQVIND